jgi:hypothetical protein
MEELVPLTSTPIAKINGTQKIDILALKVNVLSGLILCAAHER